MEIGILYIFVTCDLDLDCDPMTYIYKLDPYYLEIYGMCENEVPVIEITLNPGYNALQYNADSVITRLRSWIPIFQGLTKAG